MLQPVSVVLLSSSFSRSHDTAESPKLSRLFPTSGPLHLSLLALTQLAGCQRRWLLLHRGFAFSTNRFREPLLRHNRHISATTTLVVCRYR